MAPTDDLAHREIWSEINETKQELAKHLGGCEVRHAEIIRRQDESIRDRHGMNLKLDDLKAQVSRMFLTIAGATLLMLVSAILQFMLRK